MYSCTVQCKLENVQNDKFLKFLIAEKMTETKIENGNAHQNGDSVESKPEVDASPEKESKQDVELKPEVESKQEVEAKPVKRDLDDSDDESPAGKPQIKFFCDR